MSCLRCLVVLCFSLISQVQAHVVPSVALEADFAQDGSYRLNINLDPRVFLSDQPTSLPPVSAEWYLDKGDEEKKAALAQAVEYLKENIGLTFDDEKALLPPCDVVAIDGATNEPLKEDTAETHLLATAKGQRPAGASKFRVILGKEAKASLILVTGEGGKIERKIQAVFPGETSQPFELTPSAPSPEKELRVHEVKVTRVFPEVVKVALVIGGSLLLLFILGVFFIKRRRR